MRTLNGGAMNAQVTEFINSKATVQQSRFRVALSHVQMSPEIRALVIDLVGALLKESMYDLVPVVFASVTERLMDKLEGK